MDLSVHQQQIIREWAKQTPHVYEVRLFGSRAKGSAPHSDIDLAITVGGSTPGVVLGIYYALSPRWQDQLTERLEAKAHVALYNDPDPSPVSASCNECSVLLFSDVTGDQAKQRGVMGDGS